MGPVLAVTLGVPDSGRAAAAYCALLGIECLAEGTLSEQLAAAWNAPDCAGANWRVLGRRGVRSGMIRLVEVTGSGSPEPFRSLGWAALEVLVADAGAALARCAEQPLFEVLVAPGQVGGARHLRALQAAGPGGEGLYLTQVLEPPPGFQLPAVDCGEGLVYAAVAASADLPLTRDWFADAFGFQPVTDHQLPVRVLNRSFGLAEGSLHRISTFQLEGAALLEIDQYPAAAQERDRPAGRLPRGVAMASFAVSEEVPAALGRPLPPNPGPPYWGRAAWVVSGPGGLEFELIQAPAKVAS